MAKPATILVKLESTANTGYYYVTKKNPRNQTEKMEFRKYDPVARKHVLFKEGRIKILVATDVAGRGIHVEGVTHVVNYNLPEDPEDYVHRIGRTGRAGATGTSISFASEDDAFLLPDLEKLLGERISCSHPPSDLLN
mgnify:CR=1 FL=1